MVSGPDPTSRSPFASTSVRATAVEAGCAAFAVVCADVAVFCAAVAASRANWSTAGPPPPITSPAVNRRSSPDPSAMYATPTVSPRNRTLLSGRTSVVRTGAPVTTDPS
jgi:hypothetical protein